MRPHKIMIVGLALGVLAALTIPHALAETQLEKAAGNANSVAEYFGQKGQQYVTALEELTKEYAPQVVDAALAVVRIQGIQQLIWGAMGALWLLLWAICSFVFWKKYISPLDDNDDKIPAACSIVLLVALLIIPGVINTARIFDIWNWIAVLEPKLWIAKQLLDKVI